jgi:5'-3' exonuclease
VFDGASLPAKAKEEGERRQRRAENTEKAKKEIEERKLTSFGQVDNRLRSMIVQSVSISGEMITRTMSVLRRLNVDFVVAPYEADAQLAFVYQQGLIAGVVSEDSDLIAFGCHRLISKMDISGDFMDVRLDWAFRGPDLASKPPNVGELGKLEKWTESMFVDLCILSGSDYKLGKIAGIGIKKAFQLLNRFRSITRIADEVSKSKGWSKDDKDQFLHEFDKAKLAFQKHRVFDVKTLQCVTITDNKTESDDFHDLDDIIGPGIEPTRAKLLMTGEIEAKTGERRYFLDRLPPGVLGVYNSSLQQPAPSQPSADHTSKRLNEYDQLELELVKEFEKFSNPLFTKSEEAIEMNRKSYLSKLEGMILNVPQPSTKLSIAEEFGDIEALLLLESEEETAENETAIIELDDDEQDIIQNHQPAVQPPSQSRENKVKNPFAKNVENKKPRNSIRVASIVPHMAKENRNNNESSKTVFDILSTQQRRLSESSAPAKMVSVRQVQEKPAGRPFFRRN